MVTSGEESARDPARSVRSGATLSLWLRDYREKKGRNWEVLRKRGKGKKEEGGKRNKSEKEQAVLVFCPPPSGVRCYL